MAGKFNIISPDGLRQADIDPDGGLYSTSLEGALPPVGSQNRRRPFIERVDIHQGGTNGSVTPVTYDLLSADTTGTFDYYIQSIIHVISDGTQNYSKYGAIAALTNGVDMFTEIGGDTDYLYQSVKTGGECLLWATTATLFPADPGTITSWASNDNALVAVFDLNELIPPTGGGIGGIRIGRGTLDALKFTVNDNLTQLSDHFVFVKGFRLYE